MPWREPMLNGCPISRARYRARLRYGITTDSRGITSMLSSALNCGVTKANEIFTLPPNSRRTNSTYSRRYG